MKNFLKGLALFIVLTTLSFGVLLYKNRVQLQGLKPVLLRPPEDITEVIAGAVNSTDFPLTLPDGFALSVFAKDLPGARVLAFDAQGNLWVSSKTAGTISLLQIQDGKVMEQNAVLRNLNDPHGLAFDPKDPGMLYYAEQDKISRIRTYSDASPEVIHTLSKGGRHTTRTLGFGPDGRLYVSIGSSCDSCFETDPQRGTVYTMNKDGSDFRLFAKGLRNTVFFTWHPKTGQLWGTDMGRDNLGDDLPPDEINILTEGGDYGWPTCFGKNVADGKVSTTTACVSPKFTPTHIDILPAHSAPLGLVFTPDTWRKEFQNDLLVALHGSWNRTVPAGYKIVRYPLDENGNPEGEPVDFIRGWLTADNLALGRPVDLITDPQGNLYISDDKAGVLYKLSPL